MLPIILDSRELKIAIVGSGRQALRRLELCDAAGACFVSVFSDSPTTDMENSAGDRLISRWPNEAEIAACHIIYVADVSDILAEKFTAQARANKTLVNVEDVIPLCDFHVPAIVRRGDLLLTASTGGRSPGLARRLKAELEKIFPAVWAQRVDQLAQQRDRWRAQGASFKELIDRTNAFIDQQKWFSR